MYKLLSAIAFTIFFIKCSMLDKIEERIIGGRPCTEDDHHFAVVLRTRGNLTMCTGSLLSAYWVAAHCCHLLLGFAMIGVSTNNVSGPLDNNTKVVAIEECILHKDYDPFNILNDIAVLRLATPVKEGPTISYVPLPTKKLKGDLAWYCNRGVSMGWGLMEATANETASILQCTDLKIVCLHGEETSVFAGDSGGPFMCNGAQYGITSFGVMRNPTKAPSVSTRVDSYLGFIKNKTGVGNSARQTLADILLTLLNASIQIVIFVSFCCNHEFVTSYEQNTTEGRLIGGMPTCDGIKHDFAVLITGLNTTQKCAGTLLNSKWVLTAGHCCAMSMPFVFAGLSTGIFPVIQSEIMLLFVLMNDNVKGRSIEKCILYEHFDPVNNKNNLALMKVKREIPEGPAISYVKLPVTKMQEDFHKWCPQATSMGWGNMNNPVTSLHCVTQHMDAPDKCISIFGTKHDPKTILCSHVKGKSDIIYGDDGGPLICNNVQYGIITNQNGTYTRVDNYLEFIESNSRGTRISNSAFSTFIIFFVHIMIHIFG
nr:unnamed protein product [Callosobruchus analis]